MPIQKITSGVIESSQTLTTPIISGNLSLDSAGTTGIRVPSANTLAFYEGGVEAMRIDSSGNMGIGSSSISNKLEVVQPASADASVAVRAATDGYAASLKLISNNATGSRYNTLNSFYGSTEQWSIRSGAADSTMTFCTGSSATERMRIDANGYVTQPYQPAFGVTGTGYTVSGTVTELKYPYIITNTGSHYSASTGRFTAPVAGRYYISVSNDAIGSNDVGAIIRKNGTMVAQSWVYSVDGACSCVMIMDLAVGDYVSVGTLVGLEGALSQFCGHLIG